MITGAGVLECILRRGIGYEIRRGGLSRLSRVRGGWRRLHGLGVIDEFVTI